MKKLPRIEITELFMAKADWNRTFIGTVTRDRFDDGSQIICGKIPVNDCIVVAQATNDDDLGKNLDDIVTLILDHNLHGRNGNPRWFCIDSLREIMGEQLFGSMSKESVKIVNDLCMFYLDQMKDFELLKRTFPVSFIDRHCDGYDFIIKNSTSEERKEWGIEDDDLQKVIKSGENYIYQVAKEGREFKTMCLCIKNYEIIRKFIFKFEDE